MRRTRHVVLPVRSWQYIGLMVVSLACLTLGLVSRDREGKSGSLTSPELKHTAPHEVDACPNEYPFAHQSLIADDAVSRRINSERQMLERRMRNAGLENERLNRREMRTTIDRRRSVSLDRRHPDVARLRETRNRRIVEPARSLERRVRDFADRLSSEINTRRIQFQDRVSTIERRERMSRERSDARENLLHSRRSMSSERRNGLLISEHRDRQSRVDVRRDNVRVEERRLLERNIERRERRVQDNVRSENGHRSNNRFNQRTLNERREVRAINTAGARAEGFRISEADSSRSNSRMGRAGDLERRHVSRERRNSVTDESRLSRFVDRVSYQRSGIEFPLIKSTFGDGSYEMLRQTFMLALCTVYTASLMKRKTGFIGNILPQINRLRVW